MPNECNEDCMPRNAPKPVPLIEEVPVKPLVPEVSLLFDQDKSRSFHATSSSGENKEKGKAEYKLENPRPISPKNQLESYNSWKAKNAQALHTITGSLNRSEIKKQITGSKMSSDLRNKNTNHVFADTDSVMSSPAFRHQVPKTMYTDQERVGFNCQSERVEDFNHRQTSRPSLNHHQNMYENNPLYRRYPQNDSNFQYKDSEVDPQMINVQSAHYTHGKNAHPVSQLASHDPYTAKKVYSIPNTHVSHEPARKLQDRVHYHEPKTVQTNQVCCDCRQGNQVEIERRREEDVAHNMDFQNKESKVVSSLEIAKINNQTVMDLYKIINLQNEQILMLQQQVKQVLQIHLECDKKSVKDNPQCHNCPCEQRLNRNFNNDSNKHECNCNEKANLVQHKASCSKSVSHKTPKRSVGIMTTCNDNCRENSETDSHNSDDDDRGKASEPPKGKKSQKKQKRIKSSSNVSKNQKKRTDREEQKGKAHYVSPHEKKKNRDDCKVNNSQADNSFSLNEAELVINTDPEQDNGSTNQSVHIDLQDYCTSSDSDESESVTSQSCEDEESATEEGSSDPQLGWTFYDRVVGQVNNILKKKRSPPRQEQSRGLARRQPPNYAFDRRGDFDAENNWSKRVTFDGPPLEDQNMMGNFMHARQYQQSTPYHNYRRGHDYRVPGNPERMQDFMMYNYANGYSNLSFSTLRFLDRNDLLTPQMQVQWQEQQMLQEQHKSLKHSKPRNKSRTKDILPPRVPQPKPSQKRKTVVDPSSKLLDITALKQQPKLF